MSEDLFGEIITDAHEALRLATEYEAEIARLRDENRRLRIERDDLKQQLANIAGIET